MPHGTHFAHLFILENRHLSADDPLQVNHMRSGKLEALFSRNDGYQVDVNCLDIPIPNPQVETPAFIR
jgi:hypothetical protein